MLPDSVLHSSLATALGAEGTAFLDFGLGAILRILPHTVAYEWKLRAHEPTRVTYPDQTRRSLRVVVGLSIGERDWSVVGLVKRMHLPGGVGAIRRTIDKTERDICERVVERISAVLGPESRRGCDSLRAIRSTFDETVVAANLEHRHALHLPLGRAIAKIRGLAEQSYEAKPIAFSCIVDAGKKSRPEPGAVFPDDYLSKKKFCALSDGYHTTYEVSSYGALTGYYDLTVGELHGQEFYPEWCADVAWECDKDRLAICLTRHGDILLFQDRKLAFSYRFGRWQYWNHSHLIDILRNAIRRQKVPLARASQVARAVYRSALDVSFRRSGGLFVILRSRPLLRELVKKADSIGDKARPAADNRIDKALRHQTITTLARSVLAELASLDGAIVLDGTGRFMAYAAILEPSKRGRQKGTEGSRTKAALGASRFGTSVKISSDGEIAICWNGSELVHI